MSKGIICCIQRSEALRFAYQYLRSIGLPVTDKCAPDVQHLLLPVPSFANENGYLAHLLSDLSDDVIISGGNLDSPLLHSYKTVDFLQDPYYLAENAAITANCAVQILENHLGEIRQGLPVLILGWGRIGKCLAQALRQKGADVTVAARKPEDLAMIHALGYHSTPICHVADSLGRYRGIFNTVPEMILPELQISETSVAIELASKPGMAGDRIISARGLPGKMAPVISGKLIADTFIRLSMKEA